jgi:translation initiation factor 2B subunit (eIF-2B alpha/beta/delta family)
MKINERQKLACILAVLPVLMDFMEDLKYNHPRLYRKQVKRAGNQFIEEVEKLTSTAYKSVEMHPETDHEQFAQTIIDMGEAFKQFIEKIDDGQNSKTSNR